LDLDASAEGRISLRSSLRLLQVRKDQKEKKKSEITGCLLASQDASLLPKIY
jgi:hypothetical protein